MLKKLQQLIFWSCAKAEVLVNLLIYLSNLVYLLHTSAPKIFQDTILPIWQSNIIALL